MRRITAVISFCLIMLFAAYSLKTKAPIYQDLVREAATAIRSRKLDEARDTIRMGLRHYPNDGKLMLLDAELAMLAGDFDSSLKTLNSISTKDIESYGIAKFTAGEIHRNNGKISSAEAAYQETVTVDADFMIAHQRLASIQRWTGRPRAAQIHLMKLLRKGQLLPEQLIWLAVPGHFVKAETQLKESHLKVPSDPLPIYGMGSLAMLRGDLETAIDFFEQGLSTRFDPEIYAALGQCFLTRGDFTSLEEWRQKIPPAYFGHSEINYIIGLISETNEQHREAVVYFAACLRQEPNHRKALSHFAANLNATGHNHHASIALELLEVVARLGNTASGIDPINPSRADAMECARLLARLGRLDEARLWSAIGGEPLDANMPAQVDAVAKLERVIRDIGERPVPERQPSSLKPIRNTRRQTDDSKFVFADQAAEQGINFQYFESPDDDTEGRRMFEFTGGGVGVLDFDVDGLPDLYFTQGAEWPVTHEDKTFLDALYRQVNGHFERVDSVANIEEAEFSQGISIGDLNNDGFDDIYVANIGTNSLFLNNGDGTFHAASSLMPGQSAWTTSCVIADLNADGDADVYDVNYLSGKDWEDKICPGPAGPRVCSPRTFKPGQDRLCLSTGSGEFSDLSESSGILGAGNGLGIVVANLDRDSDLEIFVGNDLMNNYFWDRCTKDDRSVYADMSSEQGWAVSIDGTPQACMGIAAADFNGDKHIDLFITNYFNETNALYVNDANGFAQERSSAFRLQGPSLPMLGFGTQAIDVELDGDWDLFVVNGDLDDFSHENRPMQMPPQFFENVNNQRFEHVQTTEPDHYLSGRFRGRGMAKLDWNRDGLDDLAISHLDSPAALVTNQGTRASRFLRIKLVAKSTHRNAIGTKVTLNTAAASSSQQLTAGDGYQASNEKQLLFPVPLEGPINIQVHWPSGHVDHWARLAGDSEYVAVESDSLFSRPR